MLIARRSTPPPGRSSATIPPPRSPPPSSTSTSTAEFDIDACAASSVLALAGGLRARLGDDPGALELLHDAVVVGRDQGARPQLAAALDWALSPLIRTGRPDVAATFLGGAHPGRARRRRQLPRRRRRQSARHSNASAAVLGDARPTNSSPAAPR